MDKEYGIIGIIVVVIILFIYFRNTSGGASLAIHPGTQYPTGGGGGGIGSGNSGGGGIGSGNSGGGGSYQSPNSNNVISTVQNPGEQPTNTNDVLIAGLGTLGGLAGGYLDGYN